MYTYFKTIRRYYAEFPRHATKGTMIREKTKTRSFGVFLFQDDCIPMRSRDIPQKALHNITNKNKLKIIPCDAHLFQDDNTLLRGVPATCHERPFIPEKMKKKKTNVVIRCSYFKTMCITMCIPRGSRDIP